MQGPYRVKQVMQRLAFLARLGDWCVIGHRQGARTAACTKSRIKNLEKCAVIIYLIWIPIRWPTHTAIHQYCWWTGVLVTASRRNSTAWSNQN